MPHSSYQDKLTHSEVLELFDQGYYHADLDLGTVYSLKTKLELFTFEGNEEGGLWVRLYKHPKMRSIPVSHVIWIVGTRSPIPKGFEIHHRDVNNQNNRFLNLYALHVVDHRKLHRGEDLLEQGEETPF